MELNELAPGICVFNDNTNWGKEYSDIINSYLLDLFTTGQIVRNYESTTDTTYRRCKALGLDRADTCHSEDYIFQIRKVLSKKADIAISLFRKKYIMDDINKNHQWILLNYGEGDYFKYHNDDCFTYPRSLSIIIYLNDDYEGGEINFRFFDKIYKPKSGDILLFSSAFPYMHEVKPVTKGYRNAAVTWYSYAKL
jgi:Rps23 Pro-64 3,4-dihydroxylase Tpa1-like proline 4-hydroxylase